MAFCLEEFKSILNGNIPWLTPPDVLKASLLYAAIGGLHVIFWKKFGALSYGNGKGWGLISSGIKPG
jgi:hypothetical protein